MDDKLEGIELTSSGYEFACPKCGEENIDIYQLAEVVVCHSCGTKFEVTGVHNP